MIGLPTRRKTPETWARYLWDRLKFHASALVLVVPALFLGDYLFRADVPRPPAPVRGIDLAAGPFTLTLGESSAALPGAVGGGWTKSYDLRLCPGCAERIKGLYLRVGKPRNLRAAGALFGGNPFRLAASVQMPADVRADAELWVTIETWDGQTSSASVPLKAVSPNTAVFLERRAGD